MQEEAGYIRNPIYSIHNKGGKCEKGPSEASQEHVGFLYTGAADHCDYNAEARRAHTCTKSMGRMSCMWRTSSE